MGDHTGGQDYALLPSAVSFTIPGMATAATKEQVKARGWRPRRLHIEDGTDRGVALCGTRLVATPAGAGAAEHCVV
jgi:hypothetical protein